MIDNEYELEVRTCDYEDDPKKESEIKFKIIVWSTELKSIMQVDKFILLGLSSNKVKVVNMINEEQVSRECPTQAAVSCLAVSN